jgi:membrane dipeptidase
MAVAFAACSAVVCAQAPGRTKRTVSDEEVMRVHKSAIVIDTHNDITSRTVAGFDIGEPSTETHTDLPRMKKGGMGAQFFAVFVASNYVEGNHSANRTLEMIDTVRHDIIEKYPNDFLFATTAGRARSRRCWESRAAMR